MAKTHIPNPGGPGLIPGQGTRSHMLQLRVHMPPLKRFHLPQVKTQGSKINKYEKKKKILHAATKIKDPI